MREILFRGKRTDNKEWTYGFPIFQDSYVLIRFWNSEEFEYEEYLVAPESISEYTGVTDKNGKKIFEGDIVQYQTFDDFDCQSVVKFGEYKQDGSGGEYSGRKCIGFYVEVDNFTCPDWCDNEPECFPYHMWQQNILEVASKCEVIGNIFDNIEMLINN